MIKFFSPNKIKIKLTLIILLSFLCVSIFDSITNYRLNMQQRKEIEKLTSQVKYNELNKAVSELNVKSIPGKEFSSLYTKYVFIRVILFFLSTIVFSYISACIINKHWQLS